jgi:ABC-2 type transport system permease protein
VALPVILLALRDHRGAAAQAQTVAGLAVLGLLSTAYITHANGLVAARPPGVLTRWRAAPLPAWCWFAARNGATALVAAAGAVVTLAVGATFFHAPVHAAAIPGLAAVLLLGAVTWASIGTAASALIPRVEAAWPLLGLTYLPVVVLSGSFGAVSSEPGWLATLVGGLPAKPVIDGATRALGGGAPFTAHGLAVLVLWGTFRWAPRAS